MRVDCCLSLMDSYAIWVHVPGFPVFPLHHMIWTPAPPLLLLLAVPLGPQMWGIGTAAACNEGREQHCSSRRVRAFHGLIALIDNPNISDQKLFQLIPGPDFPTGGEIVSTDGFIDTYTNQKIKYYTPANTK